MASIFCVDVYGRIVRVEVCWLIGKKCTARMDFDICCMLKIKAWAALSPM